MGIVALVLGSGCANSSPVAGTEALGAHVQRAVDESPHGFEVGHGDDERWRPESALPRTHRYDREEVRRLDRYAADCTDAPGAAEGPLRKAWIWARHVCGEGPLPKAFFSEPPFMHPDGHSFAWHARACGPKCTGTDDLEHFHVLERAEVAGSGFPTLDRRTLRDLLASEPFTSDEQTLFVRRGQKYVPLALAELTAKGSRFGIGNEAACDTRSYGRCWVDRERRQGARVSQRVLVGGAVACALGLLALLVWRIRIGRELMKERLLVLRLLAHELRTPVTALKLEIEGVRNGFDRLEADHQGHFLAIAGAVARLQRVVQASVVYLRSDSKKGETARPIDSLRDFVEGIASEAGDETIEVDAPDGPVALPLTSAALAIRNVIRNAVVHGKAPRSVKAVIETRAVVVTVSDAGELPRELVRTLGRAVVVSRRADGLGLGLHLASQALRAVGGRLEVSRSPTRFTIRIPRGDA